MIYILASTSLNREFATADAINDIGGHAIVPRRVVITDKGPAYRPFMPNYLFLALTERMWSRILHRNRDCILVDNHRILPPPRHLDDILPRTWSSFQDFAHRAEVECQKRVEQWETGLQVARYRPGDKLRIVGEMLQGQLSGHFARFLRMDKGRIVAEVEGMTMMGKPFSVVVDAGQVRGIAAE